MQVEVKKVMDHYEVYVNSEFYTSCDTGELTEVLTEIESEGHNE